MYCLHRRQTGFSLIELVIGMGIIIFIISGGFLASQSLSRASVSLGMRGKAEQKLQAVAETIRQQAVGEFATMEETNADRTCPPYPAVCTDFDRKIKIQSTISAVSMENRSRTATLIASWKDKGIGQSKSLTFSIAPLRGKLQGAALKVQALDAKTNQPLAGVDVFTQGEDISTTSCRTAADGFCILTGVAVERALKLIFDGYSIRYYFPSDPSNPNAPNSGSWTKTVDAAPVTFTEIRTAAPAFLFPPAKISGEVVDVGRNVNARGVTIALRSKDGTGVFPASYNTDIQSDDTGHFDFGPVIPAQYSLNVIGSSPTYAAAALENDYSWNSRPILPIHSGDDIAFLSNTSRGPLQTIERGTMEFNVLGIDYASDFSYSIVALQPTTPTHLNLRFESSTSTVYASNGAAVQKFNFVNTVPFMEYHNEIVEFPFLQKIQIDDGSDYFARNITPNVINSTVSISSQFNYTEVAADFLTPDPYTPILVIPSPDLTHPKLSYNISGYPRGYAGYTGATAADFKFPIHGGPSTNNPTQTFYIMLKGSYGSVKGDIIDSATNEPLQLPGGFDLSYVFVTPGGIADCALSPGSSNSLTRALINTTYTVPGEHTFNTFTGSHRLAPDFGSHRTVIKYVGNGKPIAASSTFTPQLVGYKKVAGSGGAPVVQSFTDFTSENMTMKLFASNYAFLANYTIALTGNTGSWVRSTSYVPFVWGASTPLQVLPDTILDKNPDGTPIKIMVGVSYSYGTYYVAVASDDNWEFRNQPPTLPGITFTRPMGANTVFSGATLEVTKKGLSGLISVVVKNDLGQPVTDAVVHFTRSGYPDEMLDSDGTDGYQFNQVRFSMSDGVNFTLKVTHPLYNNSVIYTTEAFAGMDWNPGPIYLTPKSQGGGGGL